MVAQTHGDITRILMAWREALDMGADSLSPLSVRELEIGDTVYGHLEERTDSVDRIVMYGQPFTITSIDDQFWRRGDNPRDMRRFYSDDLPWRETNLSHGTRVLVIKHARTV